MKLLGVASLTSVVCVVLVWTYILLSLAHWQLSDTALLVLVVYPMPIAFVAVIIGAVAGLVVQARDVTRSRSGIVLMTFGHGISLILALIVLALALDGSDLSEILYYPPAITLGQLLVVAGAIVGLARRRRNAVRI